MYTHIYRHVRFTCTHSVLGMALACLQLLNSSARPQGYFILLMRLAHRSAI